MALRPIGLLDLMRRNPQKDWLMRDVEKLCEEVGLQCEPPRGGGSHFKVSHPQSPTILIIPYKKPIGNW